MYSLYPEKKTTVTRCCIDAPNIAAAVVFLLKNGSVGENYNITGESEVFNLELVQLIAKTLGKELGYEMVNHHATRPTRPGHDLRYDY